MSLRFTKMHGLGNDFMVIDGVRQTVRLTPADIKQLSSRHTGIGFDQCLIVESSNKPGIDFFYRIFNADGQSVGQCGNGARCLARFIQHYGLSNAPTLTVATHTTQLQLQLNTDHSVTVNMGQPNLNPTQIPLNIKEKAERYLIPLPDGSETWVHALNIGNPHAILLVNDLAHAPVAQLGKILCEHSLFPEQINVGFLKLATPNHIHLRVYERGCGETHACGSGAVAAAAIGRLYHQLDARIRVSLPGGDLWVDWANANAPIFLTGPACFVYEAQLLPDLNLLSQSHHTPL